MPSQQQVSVLATYWAAANAAAIVNGMAEGFARMATAQAILETGWGARAIGFNVVGMKNHGWRGLGGIATATHETNAHVSDAETDLFQVYSSLDSCFSDHCDLFLHRKFAGKYAEWTKRTNGIDYLVYRIAKPADPPWYATGDDYAASLLAVMRSPALMAISGSGANLT